MENNNAHQVKPSKRKRDTRSNGITTSMSQVSMSNPPQKRQRSMAMASVTVGKTNHIDQSTSNNKPKYLIVPDQIFKEMLSKSLTGAENLVQLLDTPEKLQFVRTYAHLLNNAFYLQLEQDFWGYYDKILTTECILSLPFDKEMAETNNLYRIKFKTKIQLEKHHKIILSRLQKADNDLNKHKQQQPFDTSIDAQGLSTIISAFVRRGQHKLCAEFERKKLILKFDVNDYRLIKAFYNLKPDENQVDITCHLRHDIQI